LLTLSEKDCFGSIVIEFSKASDYLLRQRPRSRESALVA
jgi:hypothetical protein